MPYFTPASFKFLTQLAANNNREWFHAHKPDYEAQVRDPFHHLLVDLQPALAEISPHFHADTRNVGGSLYRIQRDTRYANDKSPYKAWQGARLFHTRRRAVVSPLFYIHLQPGNCFVGGGVWGPDGPMLRKIRQFIVDNPAAWAKAVHEPALRKRYSLESSDMLVRPPRGFPEDFTYLDDLRHRHFVAMRPIADTVFTGPRLKSTIERDLQALAPLVDYLCAALDLEF